MSTTEELLASLNTYDEKVLVIDNDLRTINIPSSITSLGVESDEDVLRLHFRMPKKYCDVDLSNFSVRINYMNANNQGDIYIVQDKSFDDESITFSWLVGRNAVVYKGIVKFIVCLKHFNEYDELDKEYNTQVATLPVLEGLETEKTIEEQNSSIIETVLLQLTNIKTDLSNYQRKPKLKTIELLVDSWSLVEGLVYAQSVSVFGISKFSQVELRPSPSQLQDLLTSEISLTAANDGGLITVFAIGGIPSSDYYMQIIISEVDIS